MKLVVTEEVGTFNKTYHLTFTGMDLVKANFTPLDRMLLKDCEKEDATIADKLLALEMIARRVEEASVAK